MARDTQVTRDTIKQMLDTLQGENLMAEVDKLLAVVTHLDERVDYFQNSYWKASAETSKLREKTRSYFKDELSGDKNGSVEMDVDDINQLLRLIGADELKFTYSANVTITFKIIGVEAENEEDAKSSILDAVSYQIANDLSYQNVEDEEYDIDEVEGE
jgi:hypothetical protein